MVAAAVQPVATVIGAMRWVARQTHRQLERAGSQAEYDAIQARAVERAVMASKLTTRYGDVAIKSFARAAGAKQLAKQIGNGLSLPNAA